MTDYIKRVSQHRRLIILKFLSDSPEYASSASIIEDVCNDFSVKSDRDQVVGELFWLRENGFVTTEIEGDFIAVTATSRGVSIAAGKARHPGVKRPSAN